MRHNLFMTRENAIKKMSTLGTVKTEGNRLYVKTNGHVLSVSIQDGRTLKMWHTKSIGEAADPLTDYFPGMYWKSFNAAVKYGIY